MISRETAEHFSWGGGCDGWHLVRDAGLSVLHERMPAGAQEVRHVHRLAAQFFFVLAGTATFDLDGVLHELRTHQGIEVPPGTPHQMINRAAGDLEFLVISHPPTTGDRLPVEPSAVDDPGTWAGPHA